VLAVAHNEFKDMGVRKVRQLAKKSHVLYDVKYLFAAEQSDGDCKPRMASRSFV